MIPPSPLVEPESPVSRTWKLNIFLFKRPIKSANNLVSSWWIKTADAKRNSKKKKKKISFDLNEMLCIPLVALSLFAAVISVKQDRPDAWRVKKEFDQLASSVEAGSLSSFGC